MRDLTQNVGNVLTIQHQTCVDEIFKCTIFVGYGGVIFFTGVPPARSACKTFAEVIELDMISKKCSIHLNGIVYIEDLTRVVISYEIY